MTNDNNSNHDAEITVEKTNAGSLLGWSWVSGEGALPRFSVLSEAKEAYNPAELEDGTVVATVRTNDSGDFRLSDETGDVSFENHDT